MLVVEVARRRIACREVGHESGCKRTAACIAGPQRVGDEVEQQLFGLIGDAHDGAVLDAPALRRERYFQRPLDVRGKTPRLFQQTAQVQRLQLAQLFIFQLIKCYGIAYRAVQPGRLYLDV